MPALIPQMTIGATDLVAAFLVMSALGMIVVVLAAVLYVLSRSAADKPYFLVDTALALFSFVVGGQAVTPTLQMVALYNGIGGGAIGAIAVLELFGDKVEGATELGVMLIGALVGAVSLSSSLVAWAKLDGVIDRPVRVRGQRIVSGLVMLAALALGGDIVLTAQGGTEGMIAMPWLISLLSGCGLVFGVLITLPVGNAQMPVLISIYNAFTGLAVGLEGFALWSPALMIAGLVIGGARLILSLQMTARRRPGGLRPARSNVPGSNVQCR